MHYVRAIAPAKVNVTLRVGGKRPDGFHPLDTVFEALDLFDEITVKPCENFTLTMEGAGSENLPLDNSNLALRAAEALKARSGREIGAAIHIRKKIPIAGGMAGGSADAAGTLVALNELWGLGMNTAELMPIAASLGSDVPFCLMGGLARGRGRGEQLEELSPAVLHSWVFLTNPQGLSTPEVFRQFDYLNEKRGEETSSSAFLGSATGSETQLNAPGTNKVNAFPEHSRLSHARFSDTELSDARFSDLQLSHTQEEKQKLHTSAPASTDPLVEEMRRENGDITPYMLNDLTEAALSLRPDLREIMEKMSHYGQVLLSGSGPTIAVLAPDSTTADSIASRARSLFPYLGVVQANGPAAGAHVVEVKREKK